MVLLKLPCLIERFDTQLSACCAVFGLEGGDFNVLLNGESATNQMLVQSVVRRN